MTRKQPTTKARGRRIGRAFALATTTALAVTLGAAPAMAAPADDAADFLVANLTDDNHVVAVTDFGDFVDRGLTIDTFFALTAAGYTTEAGDVADWLDSEATNYYGAGTCTGTPSGSLSAGGLGKYSAFLLANSESASSQLTQLKCLQQSSGPDKGRFSDQGGTDFSNLIGQSWGVLALKAGDGPSLQRYRAVKYIKSRQCESNDPLYEDQNGAFSNDLSNDPTTCEADEVDVDSTAFAAQALLAVGATTTAGAALDWLGDVSDDAAGPPATEWWESTACDDMGAISLPSVNSSGLATQALDAGSRSTTAAQQWLSDQVDPTDGMPGCFNADPDIQTSNNVRATAQGLMGLLLTPYYDLL